MGCIEEEIAGDPDKKLTAMYYGGVWVPVTPGGVSLWFHRVSRVKQRLCLVELEDNPCAFPTPDRGWCLS